MFFSQNLALGHAAPVKLDFFFTSSVGVCSPSPSYVFSNITQNHGPLRSCERLKTRPHQVVNDRWEVALGLTDGSGFQQAWKKKDHPMGLE